VIAREIADEPLDARSSENANVALLLAESIRRVPERVAIFDARRGRDAARTFAALEAQTERVAGRLRAAGLDKGSHVLVLVPMSIDLYAVLGAILRIGAVAVVVNPRAGRAYVEACCRMRRPDAVVATPIGFVWGMTVAGIRAIPKRFGTVAFSAGLGNRFAETFSRQDARAARMSERDPESSGPDAAAHAFVAADDPALLTFTSGSTGRPKALLRTHGTMRAQLGALLESLPLNEDDVDVATMPVVLLANLAAGRTSLIPAVRLARPGAVDAGRLLRDIATYRATTIVASPALLERLVERLERCGGTLPQMRAVYSGGAPVMPRLMQRLTTCLPAARVVAVYGSTEAEPIAHLALDDISTADVAAMRAGAGLLAGLPAAAADVRVIRNAWGVPLGPFTENAFSALCANAGVIGEIVVAGPHVTSGYLGGAGDAETKVRVGERVFHRTGDFGCVDANGRLWLQGRAAASAAATSGAALEEAAGFGVAVRCTPFAIEVSLSFDRRIRRSAVVEIDGRRTIAIELREGVDRKSADRLGRRLALDAGGAPSDHVLVTRIPVDARHNAKTDYPALQRVVRHSLRHRSGGASREATPQ
jgi:acyl-CoA synthetase (AMP-forming)/AMP-acid ligase II